MYEHDHIVCMSVLECNAVLRYYPGVPASFPVAGLMTLATGNNYLIRENE